MCHVEDCRGRKRPRNGGEREEIKPREYISTMRWGGIATLALCARNDGEREEIKPREYICAM